MKTKILLTTLLLTTLIVMDSCSSKKAVSGHKTYPSNGNPVPIGQSTDKTYGYTEKNPIRVGGKSPANERKFLDNLAGPNGEEIHYNRESSCCPFKTKNGLFGDGGLLDKYVITWEGQHKPVILYINMYDYEQPKVPVGFTKK